MMPSLAAPGVMTPGQFGPTSRHGFPSIARRTRTMSSTGIPSVMHTMRSMPALAASRIPSAAPWGGTKITLALAPVAATACATVSKMGKSSCFVPPLPGVTPATTAVP